MATKRDLEGHISALENDLTTSRDVIEGYSREFDELREGMADLKIQLEDANWQMLIGANAHSETSGVDLKTLKGKDDLLRANIVASSLIKRIAELRGTYIYGDGITIDNATRAKSAIDDPRNQAALFSVDALLELNRQHCTSGNLIMLVDPVKKKLQRLTIQDVSASVADPDDDEDIWLIRRTWTRVSADGKQQIMHRWFRTNSCPKSYRPKSLKGPAGESVPVDANRVAVLNRVNSQPGWSWGIPDLLASLQWADKYSAYLKNQARFADALAMIAVHYKNKTVQGAKNSSSIVRTPGVAGAAITGEGTDIIQQRGASSVDFENGRPLASQAAAAGEVSVIAALADAGAAQGSFGAASTLDTPTFKFVSGRRHSMETWIKQILTLLGAPNARINWPSLEDDALHRQITSILGMWGTGLYDPEDIRAKLSDLADIIVTKPIPDGILIPNNANSWERNDIDPKLGPSMSSQKTSGANSMANGQGQSNLGTGKLAYGDEQDLDSQN